MSITSFLNIVESAFKGGLNGVKTLEQSGGTLNPAYLVERQFSAPAVFLAFTGAIKPREQDERDLNQYGRVMACRFGAMAIGKHAKSQIAAQQIALTMAEQIVVQLYRQNFGLEHVAQAYNCSIEQVAVGRDGNTGHLSFWRVTWWHGMALVPDDLQSLIDTFDGYDADHFAQDADQQTDAPTMETEETYS
ncbi:MAG: hypothetical protein C9356_12480 [Oleiphilus sp.]|nr:MAG: hypothetical protein C9356_12480 [Oleiphilus sp.]